MADLLLASLSSMVASRCLSLNCFEIVKINRVVKTMIVPTIKVIKLCMFESMPDNPSIPDLVWFEVSV